MGTRHAFIRQMKTLTDGDFVREDHGRHLTFMELKKEDHQILFAVPHEELTQKTGLDPQGALNYNEAFTWVWPWDIVNFLKAASTDFLSSTSAHPHLAYKVFSDVSGSEHATAENAKKLDKMTVDKMPTFFKNLGEHEEFKSLYPNMAKACRALGGEVNSEPLAEPETISIGEKILKIIAEVAATIGVMIAGAFGAIGLVVGIIATAAGLVAAVGAASTIAAVIVIISCALIEFIAIAFAIAILVAIVGMIVAGILIIIGKSDDHALSLETRVEQALQVA